MMTNSVENIEQRLISIVIPAKNEGCTIGLVVSDIVKLVPDVEILVVNDGSSDDTAEAAAKAGAIVITHPYSMGNGAAIKTGARNVSGEIIVFMDGDGQHKPSDISRMLAVLDEGYDMVIGARNNASQATLARFAGNKLYNRLATFMVDHKVEDLTSGFRVVKRDKFLEFLYLLPNGFSYPTTITMSFFRAGYLVKYVPIETRQRGGGSHINILKDGMKFLLIIFKVGTLYSPLKLFFPISVGLFCVGLLYYGFTFITAGRFTNMSALLFSTSLLVFMMGLISEQITSLLYSRSSDNRK